MLQPSVRRIPVTEVAKMSVGVRYFMRAASHDKRCTYIVERSDSVMLTRHAVSDINSRHDRTLQKTAATWLLLCWFSALRRTLSRPTPRQMPTAQTSFIVHGHRVTDCLSLLHYVSPLIFF